MIQLADGSSKEIQFLEPSDLVWNPVTKKATRIKFLTSGPERQPLYRISVDGKDIIVTETHPFRTVNGNVMARDLNGQDFIFVEGNQLVAIDQITIDYHETAPIVWNLELDPEEKGNENHYVVANGIVTGDLLIQRQLENSSH